MSDLYAALYNDAQAQVKEYRWQRVVGPFIDYSGSLFVLEVGNLGKLTLTQIFSMRSFCHIIHSIFHVHERSHEWLSV